MRTLTALGQAYSAVGRAADAVPLLREAIELQEKAGAFVNRSLWVRALGASRRVRLAARLFSIAVAASLTS
jgi:Tetratricopeptide repeat